MVTFPLISLVLSPIYSCPNIGHLLLNARMRLILFSHEKHVSDMRIRYYGVVVFLGSNL